MLPGPVFNAELMTTARRARYYAIRFAYGMILLFFVVQAAPPTDRGLEGLWEGGEISIADMAATGMRIFLAFAIFQGVAVLVLTPAIVAGVVADEKRRKTLHYLMASRLSSAEIILGKLFARLLHVGIFLAIGLPVMSLISLFGGVEPLLIVLVYAGTLSTVAFLAALALLVSTLARRPREANSQVYILAIAWLFIPSLIALLMPMPGGRWVQAYEWIKPVNDPVRWSSPFSLAQPASWSNPLESVLWMAGLQLAYAAGFVLLAIVGLRPIFRREGDGPRRLGWLLDPRRGRRFLPRPEVGDRAMLWKERYVSRTSGIVKIAAGVLFLVVVILLGYATYQFAEPAFIELWQYGYTASGAYSDRSAFNAYLRGMTGLFYVAWALGAASSAAAGVVGEREEDTWTSLTATPLGGEEILLAKMFGAVWGTRALGLLLLAFWLLGLASGAVHPIGFVAVVIETVVFIGYVAALGMSVSLVAKTSVRAQSATITILMITNWAYLLCCIPLRVDYSPLILLGVTPMIAGISLLSYEDISRMFTSHQLSRDVEAFLTCFLCVLFYGAAALGLTFRSIVAFDAKIDRPRRGGDQPAPPGKDGEIDLDPDQDAGGGP
jgi:ABC-type transport system involved in multi-copper enzyme maturation permease subunit